MHSSDDVTAAVERTTSAAQPTAFSARARRSLPSWLIASLSVVATLIAWQYVGRVVNPLFFSTPTSIAREVPPLVRSGELQRAFVFSMKSLSIGWALAVSSGVLIGLLRGRFRLADQITNAQLTALYSIPSVALIPMFILWFGLGITSQVAIIFLSAFFPVEINTYSGVRNIDRTLIEIGTVEGATELQLFRKILLPAILPFVMAAMRLSVGRAVVGMVVAGMFTSITGLGGLIITYGNEFATAKLFVVIIVIALLGVVLTQLVGLLERFVTPWRPDS